MGHPDDTFIVRRNTPGSAVSARSDVNKRPMIVENSALMSDSKPVTEEELIELLASRQPFPDVAVSPELAERVLGWTVQTDEGAPSA